jgi:hypothetical protein
MVAVPTPTVDALLDAWMKESEKKTEALAGSTA